MKENNELISVIVPVYNVEKYLKQCVNSIIKQTYTNIEIILIDDGSTDNSAHICDEFAQIDPRIKVFHKANGGLSSARNEGIKKSKGKYLTFIDSDDDISEDYVSYLYGLIKKYKVKLSICPYSVVNIKKNKTKIFNLGENYKEEKLNTEECLKRLLCEKGFSVSACAKLYEKSLFKNVEFPIGKLCEDNGTTYKLIMKCNNIIYGNKSKYNYYKRDNSIMNSKFNIKKLDLIELTDQMCTDIISAYPNIKTAAEKKRNHARLSVLRQMINSEENQKIIKIRKEIINYLLNNKKQILQNKYSEKREKIAIITLSINYKLFKYIWKFYEYIR